MGLKWHEVRAVIARGPEGKGSEGSEGQEGLSSLGAGRTAFWPLSVGVPVSVKKLRGMGLRKGFGPHAQSGPAGILCSHILAYLI